jgi:hypothetical protein
MLGVTFWGADRRENMPLTDRIAKAITGQKKG